jgi:predicted RNA-binding protein
MKNKMNISLDEVGNELPFKVPENYFEQFALQIETQVKPQHVAIIKLMKPWMYMAAMFVGVLILAQVFYTVYSNNNIKKTDRYESYVLSQVDESSLMDYYVNEPSK